MKELDIDQNDKSLSISAEVKAYVIQWLNEQKANGDDSIPSLANLVNQLLIEFMIEKTHEPYWIEKRKSIKLAARRTAGHSD